MIFPPRDARGAEVVLHMFTEFQRETYEPPVLA
jgi:hypothetical protein